MWIPHLCSNSKSLKAVRKQTVVVQTHCISSWTGEKRIGKPALQKQKQQQHLTVSTPSISLKLRYKTI